MAVPGGGARPVFSASDWLVNEAQDVTAHRLAVALGEQIQGTIIPWG